MVNRIVVNRIVVNRLAAHALASDALTAGALSERASRFNASGSQGLETTPAGRDVLEYLIRCALPSGTTIAVEHGDDTYRYGGLLGLAPGWVARALSETEKQRVSACLFAQVNHFGLPVGISLRVPGLVHASANERGRYPVIEGAFFGTLFARDHDIAWYSCQGDSRAVALANSSDRARRVCTDADSGCAIETVGRCQDVCANYTPGAGWSDCRAHGVSYPSVANVFLRASDPHGANQRCGPGQSCVGDAALASGARRHAVLTGDGARAFAARCDRDATCLIDGAAATTATVRVESGATADVHCQSTGTCTASAASGSRMDIDCRDAGTCTDIQCAPDASCLLQCSGATACGFDQCHGEAVDCGDGLLACGRACPRAHERDPTR